MASQQQSRLKLLEESQASIRTELSQISISLSYAKNYFIAETARVQQTVLELQQGVQQNGKDVQVIHTVTVNELLRERNLTVFCVEPRKIFFLFDLCMIALR